MARAVLGIDAAWTPAAGLERHEDALDALVCAWVGTEHLAGRTAALGDAEAAIWTPVGLADRPAGP